MQPLALLAHDDDLVGAAVGDIEIAFLVQHDVVDGGSGAVRMLHGPAGEVFAVLVEMQHARIAAAMAGHHPDIILGPESDIVGLVEQMRARGFIPGPGLALGADGHQHIAGRAQFRHRVADNIGDPDIAVTVQPEAVRLRRDIVAEAAQQFAVRIEFHQLIQRRALKHQQMPVGHHRDITDADITGAGGRRRCLHRLVRKLGRIGDGISAVGARFARRRRRGLCVERETGLGFAIAGDVGALGGGPCCGGGFAFGALRR